MSYDIVDTIGRGSYGKVYKCVDSIGAVSVMKVVDLAPLSKDCAIAAMNEVKLLSKVRHPFIVGYHNSFCENGSLHIIMEYADSGDLSQAITEKRRSGGSFSEGQIFGWFCQVSLALKYLHDKRILHRDVKAANVSLLRHFLFQVFLCQGDRIKLGDFGIAKVLDRSSALASTQIGTPLYLAPEVSLNQPYSWASDMWSLGCLLYELLFLRPPFVATCIEDLRALISDGPLTFRAEIRNLSIKNIICNLLNKSQSRRMTASELLEMPIIRTAIKKVLNCRLASEQP